MARFCYGFQIIFTPENVIPISCLACYLDMTDNYSPNNLLSQAIYFFDHKVVTGWNESVRCLKAVENQIVLQQASKLCLLDSFMDSIVNKALDNPLLLGEPIKNLVLYDRDEGFNRNVYKLNARMQLDWKSEDLCLIAFSLQFYEPIIRGMTQRKMGEYGIAE
nr:hypothetical protein [Tanacetum cinerariifolium]